MTTNPYLDEIKKHCPDTFIGLMAYFKSICNNNEIQFKNIVCSHISTLNVFIIKYIEYREVVFLEAICNNLYNHPDLRYNDLVGNTITTTLRRLEKNLLPIEGQPF